MAKSADAFRTISEVADWLETPAHVLRFWESKFSQVKPVKRAGGRRYYRPADMLLLGGIKKLLHEDGLTIKGVQKLLREQGVKHVAGLSQSLDEVTEAEVSEIAIDVPSEGPPATTAEVVSFRSDTTSDEKVQKPSEPTPVATEKTSPTRDAIEEAAVDVEETPLPDTEEEPSSAPIMPSFIQRKKDAEIPKQAEKTTEDEASVPTPLINPDIPDDPSDDIAAEPGVLTALSRLTNPVSAEVMHHLIKLADQLGSGSSASKS